MSEPRTLPPFPTDPGTLALLSVAVNPWAHDVQAECSSLGSFLEFMSQLGGSDTSAVAGEEDGVTELAHPQYSTNDVIEALVAEIQRQRGAEATLGEVRYQVDVIESLVDEVRGQREVSLEEVKARIGWHATIWDVLLLTLVITGIIAVVANA